MVEQATSALLTSQENSIQSIHISEEEYLEHYAENHYEWKDGIAIKMSPISLPHRDIVRYLEKLLEAYFSLKPIGRVVDDPFTMRLSEARSYRQPDLQIILNDNPGELTKTGMIGAADICIEVVSPGSVENDYGTKFLEYETGGVREYWLFDYLRRVALFYRLDEEKIYRLQSIDEAGYYQTPLLPRFKLHVPTLWQDRFPNYYEIGDAIKQMLSNDNQE